MRRKTILVFALGALLACLPASPPPRTAGPPADPVVSEAVPAPEPEPLPSGPLCIAGSPRALAICREWCRDGYVAGIVGPFDEPIPCEPTPEEGARA